MKKEAILTSTENYTGCNWDTLLINLTSIKDEMEKIEKSTFESKTKDKYKTKTEANEIENENVHYKIKILDFLTKTGILDDVIKTYPTHGIAIKLCSKVLAILISAVLSIESVKKSIDKRVLMKLHRTYNFCVGI